MRHIEFCHTSHFENNYHRVKPGKPLERFIDFYWQTRFDHLWNQYPRGFSDALFPNTGYTYLINLGTPFIMQVDEKKFSMKTDGFLPRSHSIECYHRTGNYLFGIKFRLSPVLYTTKVNFAEYRSYIFPLSYLMARPVLEAVKQAADFEERVVLLNEYFTSLVEAYSGAHQPINIVSDILHEYGQDGEYRTGLEDYAARYGISSRTLHRYFEAVTGNSCKKALQIIRIRRALEMSVQYPEQFDPALFGYYDHSHFYKHLRLFLRKDSLSLLKQLRT